MQNFVAIVYKLNAIDKKRVLKFTMLVDRFALTLIMVSKDCLTLWGYQMCRRIHCQMLYDG